LTFFARAGSATLPAPPAAPAPPRDFMAALTAAWSTLFEAAADDSSRASRLARASAALRSSADLAGAAGSSSSGGLFAGRGLGEDIGWLFHDIFLTFRGK